VSSRDESSICRRRGDLEIAAELSPMFATASP
jgi:hypothetical protein